MRRSSFMAGIGLAVAAAALAGCASSGSSVTPGSPPATGGKNWTVDSSGYWVPGDPQGCGTETVTCKMNAFTTRVYKNAIPNVFLTGSQVLLQCKAPTPAAIRSSVKTESKYWYYLSFEGKDYWVPDIFLTRDDIAGIAEGVPDCSSNTPGISG